MSRKATTVRSRVMVVEGSERDERDINASSIQSDTEMKGTAREECCRCLAGLGMRQVNAAIATTS